MKITVKNFGPIREAKDIEISPMTLFVGPSNTGKSYLAILLYAVLQVLKDIRFSLPFLNKESNNSKMKGVILKLLKEDAKTPESKKIIAHLAQDMFLFYLEIIGEAWKQQIVYCFGEDGKKLIENKELSVVLSFGKDIHWDIISPRKSILPNGESFSMEEFLKLRKEIKGILQVVENINVDSEKTILTMAKMINEYNLLWQGDPPSTVHYLPASRGGIMQNYHALVNVALEQTSILQQSIYNPIFSIISSDFVRKLINLKNNKFYKMRKRNMEISRIRKQMESKIMGGSIDVKMNETGYPNYRYQFKKDNKNHFLSLKNTSSMVSELAPLSIFMRYHLGTKDLFIIEEPETNLHPQGQREIADVLVRLANAGVFVLATTHSDIVLEQISNAVHASQVKEFNPKAKIKLLGKNIDKGALLDEEKAAVYSFTKQDKKGGTVVKRIKFKGAAGFVPEDHLKISQDLYNETARLYNSKS